MRLDVVVVGGGVGGLSAALRLARRGVRVRLLEGRGVVGGLASEVEREPLRFDGGPYVLLDRPGLEWAFSALGLDLSERVPLVKLDELYEVASEAGPPLRFSADRARTAVGFERQWPGSGRLYLDYVAWAERAYARLYPLLFRSRPGLADVLGTSAWREARTVLRSLGTTLRRTGLPAPVQAAIAVWTHVAGQQVAAAPSFMAFVPALVHGQGAHYPSEGMGAIPAALARAALAAGVEIETGRRIAAIHHLAGRVNGVELEDGGFIPARAVISNVGLATYFRLLRPALDPPRRRLAGLPLQSPGVCAYLRVVGTPRAPYLRFRTDALGCRVFVSTAALGTHAAGTAWKARLMGPMDQAQAEAVGPTGQQEYLERWLAESWWREGLDKVEVVATRTPAAWGAEFSLHRNAMNPVMTARLMRKGRLAHRSPWLRGLYLAGSATHPGQWVSFCAVSGVLAADCLIDDLD